MNINGIRFNNLIISVKNLLPLKYYILRYWGYDSNITFWGNTIQPMTSISGFPLLWLYHTSF